MSNVRRDVSTDVGSIPFRSLLMGGVREATNTDADTDTYTGKSKYVARKVNISTQIKRTSALQFGIVLSSSAILYLVSWFDNCSRLQN